MGALTPEVQIASAHQSEDAVSERGLRVFASRNHEGRKVRPCGGADGLGHGANIIGTGDFAAQARKAMENVKLALEAGGATLADVIRTRIYVVNYKPEHVEIIGALNKEFFPGDNPPASTLLGVQALALPDFLIEIEATAVIDD